MSYPKGILSSKRSHFLGITWFPSFLLCLSIAALAVGCHSKEVIPNTPGSDQANAETEVTDDRDAILEELVECYPCFADPKADECNSGKECDGVEELVKNETCLNRFFDNNQAAFDARLKVLQKEIDGCVDEYETGAFYFGR